MAKLVYGDTVDRKILVCLQNPVYPRTWSYKSVTSLFNFLLGPVSVAFCGHLGKTQLATVGLSTSVFNVAGMFVVNGLVTASDTIFAQTYGSPHKSRLEAQLKKTMILITMCCVICCSMYICCEPILLLLGQNPLVAKLTSEYLLYLIPALFFASWGLVLTSYIQCQNHVYGPLLVMIVTNCVNALLHYVLLFHLHMDVQASAIAQSISFAFQDICYLLYIQLDKSLVEISYGFSLDPLLEWKEWSWLAIPGVFMITLEWILFEIGSFIAGYLGERELAAQTVMLNIDTLGYTLLPRGVGNAAAIRVGQYLGGRVAAGPQSVLSTTLLILWIIGPGYFGSYMALRWYIPQIFTSDLEVIALAAQLMAVLATFQLLDGTTGLISGVLRGAGLQYLGAIINIICLYFIGAPISICLIFIRGMGLMGLWIGFIAGAGVQTVVYLVACTQINWKHQVERAVKRLKEKSISEQAINSLNGVYISDFGIRNGLPSLTNGTKNEPAQTNNTITDVKFRSTTAFVIKRVLMFLIVLLILSVSVGCRLTLRWSDYFGTFCVYPDGTYVSVSNRTNTDNCTIVIP
ncbi:unnamed protein product [Calicophoron daubneyi]|uniref:Multidrug and toxin extrusion protein n=1 Tax=Calicophoron daubneyi TaxID=300641 RepID=A0AAV2TF12_CALDB